MKLCPMAGVSSVNSSPHSVQVEILCPGLVQPAGTVWTSSSAWGHAVGEVGTLLGAVV